MTKRGKNPTSPAEKPTVYRGVMAIVGGVLVTGFCIYGAIDLLVETGSADLIGSAVLILVAVFALVFGIYPAAFSDDEGLLVRNPFRTIHLPWSSVTELSANLSFVAHTQDKRYTVFAIPVSLRDRRKAERQRIRAIADAQREARRASRGGGGGGRGSEFFGGSGGASRYGMQDEHIERMAFADQAISEMNARRDAYNARARIAAKAAAGAGNGGNGGNGDSDAVAGQAASAAAVDAGASGAATGDAAAAGAGVSGATASDAASTGAKTPEAPTVAWAWPSLALSGASALFLIIAIIVK